MNRDNAAISTKPASMGTQSCRPLKRISPNFTLTIVRSDLLLVVLARIHRIAYKNRQGYQGDQSRERIDDREISVVVLSAPYPTVAHSETNLVIGITVLPGGATFKSELTTIPLVQGQN